MGRRQHGFTLVELAIALVLLMLGLMLAAQLLMETSQLYNETSGEVLDTPVPLVIARIRGDVQGSAAASPVMDFDGSLAAVKMSGGQEGQIVYELRGLDLYRTVTPVGGPEQKPSVLWRGVSSWRCQVVGGTSLLDLTITYRRRKVPHTPLATMPADRGPTEEELTQRLFLLPRGGGLGDTW